MAKKKVKSKSKQPVKSSIPDSISSEVIAEACSSVTLPVFMKVCRLCESKDGPFLNIFDADKVTARKIDELMPFGIAENDDLPHKICFRCSAKLEELYEFIHRCIKTQESLRTAVGKTGPFIIKTKTRKAWEDKLNKTNMSNDDICDALIKKAMEGIKDIPLKPKEEEAPPPTKRVTRRTDAKQIKKESIEDDNEFIINLKEEKLTQQKNDGKLATKSTRSNNPSDNSNTSKQSNNIEAPQPSININSQNERKTYENKAKNNSQVINLSFDYADEKTSSDNEVEIKESVDEKPFNIMDYISMIKVNGVGVLFQCKLCNRNFLKKEVVESHNCAKNGIKLAKNVAIPKSAPMPEPPKVCTVKYITIEDNKKPHSWNSYKFDNDNSTVNENKTDKTETDNNKNDKLSKDINIKQEQSIQPVPPIKPKPKAGPASKTRRTEVKSDPGSSQNSTDIQQSQASNSQSPSVHIPSAPNLNGRFKLVPGPNNIFTLVEDTIAAAEATAVTEKQKTAKKRKSEPEHEKSKDRKKDSPEKSKSSEVIDIEDQSKPYPVGLFQTVAPTPAPFTTPAMKKQSYTIVQTGNPSKLLISTKAVAPPAEVPKKRQRKTKLEVREDSEPKEQPQPFRVTLEEDVAHPKDTGFFTFINVDPLLQPSYVLPTDNIIQESQISTSTAAIHSAAQGSKESKDKDKYPCNMCGESFSREKKLLSHIQSHYTKMDEEDQQRSGKTTKKKGRK